MEAARLFSERFGTLPDVVVRAPGRVNLVGEHTDYAGLPVLPFAIDRSVTVAAGPAGRVEGWSDAFGPAGPPWWRYVEQALAVAGDPGVRLAVAGDLPHEGGLSSSSALTVGVLAACDLLSSGGIDRESMVERALRAERGMGVEGGAMDQTVITFARPGSALRIDFDPPRLLPVVIPEEVRVVVAYSGTPAPKAGAARDAYNRSVLSTRVAAALLAAKAGADPGDPPLLSRVRDASPQAVAALPEEISCRAAAAGVGRDPSSLARMTAGSADLDAPLPVGPVARHVLSEAGRVDRAIAALEAVDGPALGRVLDGSHASLAAGGYSTPDLDRLVEAMRASGAWGARLTGAGFGGYAVAVAPQPVVSAVVAAAVAATGGPAFEVRPSGGVDRA